MKNKFVKQLSVIVPTFNEKDNIGELIERISNSLVLNGFFYEILVIDDGSIDGTEEIVQRLSSTYPVSFFSKRGKKGKAYSLFEGFAKAVYQNLAFIDADLQYPPEEIVKMALKLRNTDVVVANRKSYQDNFVRKVSSKVFKIAFGRTLFKLPHDIQSGLKVFKKEVINTVKFTPASAWTFDLEFLHRASKAGFLIEDHNIVFSKRKEGVSKIGLLKTSIEIGSKAVLLKCKKVKPFSIPSLKEGSMKGAGTRHNGKKYVTHTTLPYKDSALTTFTTLQKTLITVIVLSVFLGLFVNTLGTLSLLVCILSLIYFADTLFNLYIVTKSLRHSNEVHITNKALSGIEEGKLPIYTILCPLYKEAHIIPQFVKNISSLSWPKEKLDVMLLLEEDDKDSILKARKLKLPSYVRIVVVPNSQPKTKPKACNYGLSFAKGEYLVIYDAEDKPDTLQLKKAYLAFKKGDRKTVCYQAKLNYYNPTQNLLTRFFTAEYSLWFGITLTGFQSINTSIPLGGTSNHFRTKDIVSLHGWDPFNVTEDADLGMRLFKAGYKTAIIDSTTLEEANSKWGNWVRQRSRWIKGYMQTYLVHTRRSFEFAKKSKVHFPLFHLIVGGKIAFILINPFLWLATIAYFTLYAYVGPTIESLYPSYVFYIAMISLTFGNFLFFYYYLVALAKREDLSLMKYVFLIPFYWLMISVAGAMALYQLFFKPFYWEKTVHGLHLLKPKTAIAKPQKQKRVVEKPAFGWAGAIGAIAMPFVFVGNIERKIVVNSVGAVKRTVLAPLKFAMSLFI